MLLAGSAAQQPPSRQRASCSRRISKCMADFAMLVNSIIVFASRAPSCSCIPRALRLGGKMLARTHGPLATTGWPALAMSDASCMFFLSLFVLVAGVVGRYATGRAITGMRGARGQARFCYWVGQQCARVMLLGGLLGGCYRCAVRPPPPTLRECRCKQHRTHVAPALATATLLLCEPRLTRWHNSRSVHGMAD